MSLLVVGADHGGFLLKEDLKKAAGELGWKVQDVGTHSPEPVDYPDVAHKLALEVLASADALGLMVDGAGVGSAMSANKVPGIRAAVANEIYTARNAREHNHANVLCLGSQVIGAGVAREVLRAFLTTKPGGERHERRVNKIRELERTYALSGGVTPALVEKITKILLESLSAKPTKAAATAAVKRPKTRPVLSERDVLAADRKRPLVVAPGTLVTPQARDTARALGLKITEEPGG